MTFRPVVGTPFENLQAENPLRGHRLYQASFLVRDYGYSFEDFEFSSIGNLALDTDPKMYWAEKHLRHNPVELNNASKEELLRVPGIGPKRVELIANYRKKNKIKSENDLLKLGLPIEKVAKFILLNGRKLVHQLEFFL